MGDFDFEQSAVTKQCFVFSSLATCMHAIISGRTEETEGSARCAASHLAPLRNAGCLDNCLKGTPFPYSVSYTLYGQR